MTVDLNYNSLKLAVVMLRSAHTARRMANFKYLTMRDDGCFADYSVETLEEARRELLDVIHDSRMASEENLVRSALLRLSPLDYQLIKFFRGSAMLSFEFPIESISDSMALFQMRQELDRYLNHQSKSRLEALVLSANVIIDESEGEANKKLQAIYDELWLLYVLD